MQRASLLAVSTAAVLLGLQPLVAAHGDEHGNSGMDMSMDGPQGDHEPVPAQDPVSYWSLAEHVALMYAHVFFMVIAWVVFGPIAVMLSIARSRLTFFAQILFLAVNAIGLVLGIFYRRNTPNLYDNNAHNKIGWIITCIASAWAFMGLVRTYVDRTKQTDLGSATHPMSTTALAQYSRVNQSPTSPTDDVRWSRDSGQGTERNSESLFSHSRSLSDQSEIQRFDLTEQRYNRDIGDEYDWAEYAEKRSFLQDTIVDRFLTQKIAKLASFGMALRVIDFSYILIERFVPILGFLAISTGAIALGGIGKGSGVFNVLAHFIKGAIFFWYGLLTLGRWLGCFADFGWAWNLKPPKEVVGHARSSIPTAEFTESFVIFLYGISNVFLEHLAAWGDAWTPQDLEHVSISVMFFGAGLLGMLVESGRIRQLLDTYILSHDRSSSGQFLEPKSYRVSLNPVPGLTIMLLGIMMSSHHQASMLSTMVHKQWGTLFVGFAMARAVTYILLYLSPPTSYLPSRPPSEIVCGFCLTAGGITFMLSNKDTIRRMEEYGLDAMFTFTITMGFTCLILAWTTFVVAVKGWTARRERPRKMMFSSHSV